MSHLLTIATAGGSVTTLTVTINGQVVASMDDIRRGAPGFSRAVRLRESNRIRVRAAGQAGAQVEVRVEAVGPSSDKSPQKLTVASATFGGGQLGVFTAFESPKDVVNDTVTMSLSTRGPQLVFVVDGAGQIRGMALALANAGSVRAPIVDAGSTVSALVFMAPGIAESDPALASGAMSTLLGLPCVASLAQQAAGLLPQLPISALASDPSFGPAFEACVLAAHAATSSGATPRIAYTATADRITVDVDTGNGQRSVQFQNSAARWLEVYAQPSTGPGATLPPRYVGLIPSKAPLSWGSLFTLSVGSPGIGSDPEFPLETSPRVSYWMRGPGFASGGPTPPSGTFPGSAWMGTVTFNVLVPLVDLLAGASCFGGPSQAIAGALQVLSVAKAAGVDGTQLFASVANGAGLAASSINFSIAMISIIADDPTVLPAVGACVANSVATSVFWLIRVPGAVFSLYNLSLFVEDLLTLPSTTLFDVPTFYPSAPSGLSGSWLGRHGNDDPQQGGNASYYASIDFSRSTNQVSSAACGSGGTISGQSGTTFTVNYPGCATELVTYSIQNGVFTATGRATAQSDGRVYNTTWTLKAPPSSLVAYYPLDFDGSDRSGNGNDGSATNVTFTSGGPFGEVFGRFNGSSSRVTIADANRLRLLNTSYTLSAWVHLAVYGGGADRPLLFKGDSNWVNGCFNCIANGYQWWYGWGNDLITSNPLKSAVAIGNALGNWVHLAVVYDKTAGTLTTYADGVVQTVYFTEYSGPIPPLTGGSTAPLYLGYTVNYGGSWFNGGMDDVRIYDAVLTSQQVQALRTP
jgi:hypothetical protein